MRKSYKMADLECAHCAGKMEDAIRKIEGVQSARISFMAQRLTVTADDEHFSEIMEKADQLCRKIEPDCRILFK